MKLTNLVVLAALAPLAGCASMDRMAAADARIATLEKQLADAAAQQQALRVRLDDALRLSTTAKLDAATALMLANR
jgi:hypothetical protein